MSSPRWKFAPSQLILAAAIGVIVVLAASFAQDQWWQYRQAMAQGERATRGAAVVLAEHTALAFEAADTTIRAVRQVRQDTQQDRSRDHDILKALNDGSQILRAIGLVDAAGNRVASSLFANPPAANIAEQEHFTAQRDGKAVGGNLYVAAPIRSNLEQGSWMIAVSLPVTGGDGRFAGIAAGLIDPAQLARVYGSLDLGASAIVTLFRRDGVILAREPFDAELLGESLAGRPFITETVAQAPVGTFHAYGLGDGAERVIGYATAPGSAFIVSVALRHDEVLAAFRDDLWDGGIRLALTVIALSLGTWLLVRQVRRREALARDLSASEARFRDFAAGAGDWFWETDQEHRLTWISDGIGKKSGLTLDAHSGMTLWQLIDADSVPQATIEAHRETLQAQRPFHDFFYARMTTQGRRWLIGSGVPLFDAQGRFRGFRGSARDITDLRRAEARLQAALEAIPGDFMLFDPQDRLVFSNRKSEQDLWAMGSPAEPGDTMEAILRRGVTSGEMLDAAADPEGWIAWRMQQHRSPGSKILVRFERGVAEVIERRTEDGSVVMLRFDVTEREAARVALQDARDAAEAANRAKSYFLASMSHELRTPLNAIIGFGQLLQLNQQGNLSAAQIEHCDIIVRSGAHLLNLVDDVLDLSGIEAGGLSLSPAPVDVGTVLAEALATVRPVAEQAGVAIAPLPSIAVVQVHADRQRLSQILINLLSNAIKYNRPSGSVSVAVTGTDAATVRIAVTDTGIGIVPEDAAKLFVPFQRLGAEFSSIQGTGIGLALCKRLIEMMNGKIGFESPPDGGSTFWIELALASTSAVPAEAGRDRRGGARTAAGHFSLLYVEDNPINQGLVGHILETLPQVTLHAAWDGAQGVALALAHRPDVIVLDLNLPDMNGFEVLQRLKADDDTAGMPVIALTAAAMPDDVERGLQAGFTEYLTKPLDIGRLLAAIDTALQGRQDLGAVE